MLFGKTPSVRDYGCRSGTDVQFRKPEVLPRTAGFIRITWNNPPRVWLVLLLSPIFPSSELLTVTECSRMMSMPVWAYSNIYIYNICTYARTYYSFGFPHAQLRYHVQPSPRSAFLPSIFLCKVHRLVFPESTACYHPVNFDGSLPDLKLQIRYSVKLCRWLLALDRRCTHVLQQRK